MCEDKNRSGRSTQVQTNKGCDPIFMASLTGTAVVAGLTLPKSHDPSSNFLEDLAGRWELRTKRLSLSCRRHTSSKWPSKAQAFACIFGRRRENYHTYAIKLFNCHLCLSTTSEGDACAVAEALTLVHVDVQPLSVGRVSVLLTRSPQARKQQCSGAASVPSESHPPTSESEPRA